MLVGQLRLFKTIMKVKILILFENVTVSILGVLKASDELLVSS